MKKLLLSILVTMLVIVGSCRAECADKIRVAYIPITDCLQVLTANKLGIFKQFELDLDLVPVQDGSRALEALISGEVDIAFSNLVSVISAKANKAPLKIISGGSLDSSSRPIHGLLISSSSKINKVADFEGKSVALPFRRSIDYAYLVAYFERNKINVNKINFVEVPWPQMPKVLASGRVSAIATADPFLTLALQDGDVSIFSRYFNEISPRSVVAAYISSEKWISTHLDVIDRFRKGIALATKTLNGDEEEARKLIIEYTKIAPEIVNKMVVTEFVDTINVDKLQELIDLMRYSKLLNEKVDSASLLTL